MTFDERVETLPRPFYYEFSKGTRNATLFLGISWRASKDIDVDYNAIFFPSLAAVPLLSLFL